MPWLCQNNVVRTMPLGHLELDTGVAWGSPSTDGNHFAIRTSLYTATMEGTVGSSLSFRAWIDATELADSVLRIELAGPDVSRLAPKLVWCVWPPVLLCHDATMPSAPVCRCVQRSVASTIVARLSSDLGCHPVLSLQTTTILCSPIDRHV